MTTSDIAVAVEPLQCGACGSPVALGPGLHVTCPACGKPVEVPARYRTLWAEQAREGAARRELETRYAAAARVPARWVDALAVALVVVLPAATAVAWMAVASRAVDTVALFSDAIVPALLPGAALWLWSSALHATIVRFQLALGCRAPAKEGGPSRCRHCDAPIDVPADALSVRCPYCGTDNLRVDVAAMTRRVAARAGRGAAHARPGRRGAATAPPPAGRGRRGGGGAVRARDVGGRVRVRADERPGRVTTSAACAARRRAGSSRR